MSRDPLRDFGSYRIVRKLGEGRMAEAYLARQRGADGLERDVVIKRIAPDHPAGAELRAMFLDEARVLTRLAHPCIVSVIELCRVDGEPVLVMEHVDGPSLRELMDAAAGTPALPRPEALLVVIDLADALDHVHSRSDDAGRSFALVHRDITPGNVLIGRGGTVKLIDFGIAKSRVHVNETGSGITKGTPGYIAPERYLGGRADHRADLFALGVLVYELLIGRAPFPARAPLKLLDDLVAGRYPRPHEVGTDVSAEVAALIERCLAADPAARPESAGAVAEVLVSHLRGRGELPTRRSLARAVAERLSAR